MRLGLQETVNICIMEKCGAKCDLCEAATVIGNGDQRELSM